VLQTPLALHSPATVDDLGIKGSLYLWALLTAQERRLPVAPTKRLAIRVFSLLEEMGIVQLPWPGTPWENDPFAYATPIEGIKWRLTWSAYEPEHLIQGLEDYFDSLNRDEYTVAPLLRQWVELSVGETERYFEHLLLKHRFPIEWAQDIAYASNDLDVVLTMAQWRYCAWAAVRRGASLAMQNGPHAEGIREAVYQELKRRAVSVASGAWNGASFPPKSTSPDNALGRGFANRMTQLGDRYWTACPSLDALLKSSVRPASTRA